MVNNTSFRVMTYNVGSGRKDFGTISSEVVATIKQLAPDVLGIQETTQWIDAEGNNHLTCEEIAKSSGFEGNFFFGKTLSLKENMQVKKDIMVHGIYEDWEDWAKGNALFSKSGFSRLSNAEIAGRPRNVPLFMPGTYQGTRDTDPRYAIISRIYRPPVNPFIVNLHFTTLLGERGGEKMKIPGKSERAELLRVEQAKRLLDLLAPKLEEKQMIILLGDFNAEPKEACIGTVIEGEGGFKRLIPRNDIATLPNVEKRVDHIFVYPPEDIVSYDCWIEVNNNSTIASDHLPVVADIKFK